MPAPNIVNVSTIIGSTAVQKTTTTAGAIVSNLSGSGQVIKVNALYLSNIDAANSVDVDVDIFRSSASYRIAKGITIPIKSTLDYISKSIYLEEGDSLRITASANLRLESVCSYEVIS
jgi:hypothetical protein